VKNDLEIRGDSLAGIVVALYGGQDARRWSLAVLVSFDAQEYGGFQRVITFYAVLVAVGFL